MMLFALSSQRLELENTSQDVSWLTQNQLSLMRLDLELTDNSSIQSNSFLVKRMLPTTSPEVTTPLVEKLSISVLTESENLLTIVLDFKVSSSSTLLEEVLDQVQVLFFWRDFLLIMVRSLNQVSQSILPHKSLLLLLNHTTQFFLLTHCWNILMLLLCWIMKPFMIFVEEIWILKDQPIPILTDQLLRSSHH